MSPDATPKTVDAYIDALPQPQQDTAAAIRKAVMGADSEMTGSIKYSQIVFEVGGPVAALKAHPKHVTLTFWRGATLADPSKALQGDGDRMRHIRFTSPADVTTTVVAGLVREAVKLNRELGDPTMRSRKSGSS